MKVSKVIQWIVQSVSTSIEKQYQYKHLDIFMDTVSGQVKNKHDVHLYTRCNLLDAIFIQ